jgi:hypothetical protein
MPVYLVLSFSQRRKYHNFQYLGQKAGKLNFLEMNSLVEMDTIRNRQNLRRSDRTIVPKDGTGYRGAGLSLKTHPKKPTQKKQKTHLKKPTKNGFFGFF